jgi:hypothetical protein
MGCLCTLKISDDCFILFFEASPEAMLPGILSSRSPGRSWSSVMVHILLMNAHPLDIAFRMRLSRANSVTNQSHQSNAANRGRGENVKEI